MTPSGRTTWVLAAAILLGIAAFLFLGRAPYDSAAPANRPIAVPAAAPAPVPRLQSSAPAAEPAGSTIADALNAPDGTIRRDLEILQELMVAFHTNFPEHGNPVGENNEITAALTGKNPVHFVFISRGHSAINARGELCDRWGTPFHFHQISGTQMEIRSAGPDRKFGTADDVVSDH
jgi:hypothetical protein